MLKNKPFESPHNLAKLALIVISALLMYGCSGLTKSDVPATSTWWLEPLKSDEMPGSSASVNDDTTSVLVNVTVVPGLDTANILNLSPNAELSYYTSARWADELPELMSSIVGRTLEAQGNYQVVNRRDSRDLNRCVLRVDLKAFYAELNQAGGTEDIHIAYTGEYRCQGLPIRYLKFNSRTPVKADKMSTIVASFQSGLNASLEQLLTQIQ